MRTENQNKEMPETDLFGDAIERLPNLVLEEPTFEDWETMRTALESRCNKQELLHYAEAFIPLMEQYGDILCATRDGRIRKATECVDMVKSNSSKRQIAQGLAIFLAHRQNIETYLSSLSANMKTLWRMVLANVYVSMETAKKVLGISYNLYNSNKRSYYYSSGGKWADYEYGFFSETSYYTEKPEKWGYREQEKYIIVNSFVRNLFFPIFFPETEEDIPSMAELPDGNWHTVNLETDSVNRYQLFYGLFKQGEFELKKKGVGASDIKRAEKKLSLSEIFTNSSNTYLQHLRVFNYLQLLVINEYAKLSEKKKKQKDDIETYQDNLRYLVTHFSAFDYYLPTILFPHIKGLRKQMTDYSREPVLATMLFSLLRRQPERWVAINDLLLMITAEESSTNISRFASTVFYPGDEHYTTLLVNEYTQKTIMAENYTQEFGYTALQGFALMLCSLGIAEVALNEEETKQSISPFDSVEYLRLTHLGRYALGLTDEYQAPELDHIAYFELDPDRLIIRSLMEPNPYAQLLKDTSMPISKNRFETSALSFLANCHTKADVEGKIKIFRQFISNELPPLWEQFFETLLRHCNPLKEDKTAYKRYTLDPNNRELVQLITTDPALRQIVIRAEGYRILVKNDDLKKFETQLKKHGYLL